jgi:hypothetical protein
LPARDCLGAWCCPTAVLEIGCLSSAERDTSHTQGTSCGPESEILQEPRLQPWGVRVCGRQGQASHHGHVMLPTLHAAFIDCAPRARHDRPTP